MKRIGFIFLVVFGVASTLIACDGPAFLHRVTGSGKLVTERRTLTDFHGVEAGGAFEVIITAQKDYSVEVEADDNVIKHIQTFVRDGILHIETEDYNFSDATMRVHITLPHLDLIDISGASKAMVSQINTNNLTLAVSGASSVRAEGTSKRLVGEISGASSLSAEDLSAERVMIEVSGASKGHITATEWLTAEASGASTITYAGDPKNREVETSGASSVKRR
jgi:hypothetical protein